MYHNLFIHSSTKGHLGCFQVLAIINKAAIVTDSGVQLLTAQKPIKSQDWWKGKFALFWMPANVGEGGLLSRGQLPPN